MMDAISVRDLHKSYGSKAVLRGLSFAVKQGEIFALLGVNGAGKTTAMECIEGLRRPDSGALHVCGHDVACELPAVQRVLGVQLQSTSLPETMTAAEAMRMFCAWHGARYRKDLLERFGMAGEYLKKPYDALSTGRKRRLHLALALCHDPKVVILDEPTAGLDVEGRHALHEQLRRLKADGVSILIATHDMAEAEALSDTLAILKDGGIAKQGSPLELTASFPSRVLIKTRADSLANPPGDVRAPERLLDGYLSFVCQDASETLLRLLTHVRASGDAVLDMRLERAGIEDLFLSVAGGASI